MIPDGLIHDRVARVLMRNGRAERLSPVQSIMVDAVLRAGGRVAEVRLALSPDPMFDKRELRRLPVTFQRVGVALVRSDRAISLIDTDGAAA